MIWRKWKAATLAFVLGVLLSLSPSAVSAAVATSPWYYYGPIFGYSYQNEAEVDSGIGVFAYTYVRTQDMSTVPTGYMAVWAGLYNSSGQLLESSGNWAYNDQPVSDFWIASATHYTSGASTVKE